MGKITTISPLRQRMIEDMTARNLGHHAQRSHIYSCVGCSIGRSAGLAPFRILSTCVVARR
jgi:hypothetical protein